jgi:hypothetical protein
MDGDIVAFLGVYAEGDLHISRGNTSGRAR